ncbi:hypothetical protein JOC24_006632 [Streptomyces sp. HB132]|nr:hypothetical protein [Streptomyces sp. HB132]
MPHLSGLGPVMSATRNYLYSLNAELAGTGIYVGALTIASLITRSEVSAAAQAAFESADGPQFPVADPDDLAEHYWNMYTKRDRVEQFHPESLTPGHGVAPATLEQDAQRQAPAQGGGECLVRSLTTDASVPCFGAHVRRSGPARSHPKRRSHFGPVGQSGDLTPPPDCPTGFKWPMEQGLTPRQRRRATQQNSSRCLASRSISDHVRIQSRTPACAYWVGSLSSRPSHATTTVPARRQRRARR